MSSCDKASPETPAVLLDNTGCLTDTYTVSGLKRDNSPPLMQLSYNFKPGKVLTMENLLRMRSNRLGLIALLAMVSPAWGDNPQSALDHQARQRAEFQQRVQELDSPCYETRCQAAAQMERWLGMPE